MKLVLGTVDRGRKLEGRAKDRETVRGTERAKVRREIILNDIKKVWRELGECAKGKTGGR